MNPNYYEIIGIENERVIIETDLTWDQFDQEIINHKHGEFEGAVDVDKLIEDIKEKDYHARVFSLDGTFRIMGNIY